MEGQGIVLLEAMAAGTPSIATRAEGSGVVDVIVNNFNGLLVSEDKIGYAVRRLLLDEELHKRLSRNGMKHVKKYSWDETARRIEKIYEMTMNMKEN
jgi:glycosyltransferase involved in cell wall biosynthesis